MNSLLAKIAKISLDDSTFWVIAAVFQLVSNHLLVQGDMEAATKFGILAAVFWILASLRLTSKMSKISFKDFIVPVFLILGSVLFLISYLIKPAVLTYNGLTWKKIQEAPLAGTKLSNEDLGAALATKLQFTLDEWTAFGVTDLNGTHFVVKDGEYFVPVADNLDKMMQDLKMIWYIIIGGGLSFAVAAGMTFYDTKGFFRKGFSYKLIPAGATCFVIGAALTVLSMSMNMTGNPQSWLSYVSAFFLLLGAVCWKTSNIMISVAETTKSSESPDREFLRRSYREEDVDRTSVGEGGER